MARVPTTRKLLSSIVANPQTPQSVSYLLANQAVYAHYSSIGELISDLDEPGIGARLRGVVHHLSVLRRAIVDTLWSHEVFVGVTVIDDLLFYYLRQPNCTDPIQETVAFIRDRGLHRPGIVVYPIHSLGLHGCGFLGVVAKARVLLAIGDAGVVIAPQANSFARALTNLNEARKLLGVTGEIPRDLLEHWHRARPLDWFHRNPLLVFSIRNRPGSYYENQNFVLLRMRYLATL